MEPWQLGVAEIVRQVAARSLSPVELVGSLLARIAVVEPEVEAWVTLDEDGALARARRLADDLAGGAALGLLGGVPVGVKDIFWTAGLRTTASSSVLADFVPEEDATAVARLRAADAVLLGKLHTAEFAASDPPPTRNPWDPAHTPGGSSSGSGAAVAAGMVPAALGTQTVGSVLRPAAYNGVVGLKPTYGLVPCTGVIPRAWTFDHVGVLARSVADAALVLQAVAGPDGRDPASDGARPEPYGERAVPVPAPPRLGLAVGGDVDLCEPEARALTETAVERLAAAGAEVVEAAMPASWERQRDTQRTIMVCEAAAYHEERFAVDASRYGPRLAAMVRQGLATTATAYVRALRARPSVVRDLEAVLDGVDAVLTPTASGPAPRDLSTTGDPTLQGPWSYAGLPALSLPFARTAAGLPLGLQVVGRRWGDTALLAVAAWCEEVLGFDEHPW